LFQANAALLSSEAAFLFFSMTGSKGKTLKLTPVVTTVPADLFTPLAVYLKLAKNRENAFLLESVEGNASVARYSFIGASPKSVVRSEGDVFELRSVNATEKFAGSVLEFLRCHFERFEVELADGLPPFCGGAIGYIGFDCVDHIEPKLRDPERDGTAAELMFFDSVVAFDHVKQEIKVITLSAEGNGFANRETAKASNEHIRDVLFNESIDLPFPSEQVVDQQIRSNFERADFEAAVFRIKELIRAGECYQVVLSQCFERATNAGALSIYRALRSLNPSPYMFLLKLTDRSVIGASPEMLVRAKGKRLEYRPIAGTRPRGRSEDEDRVLAEELSVDKKEIAEHMMLVDLGRNDLGRVAAFGSVKIDRLKTIEKYSHVQHLVSAISAELGDNKDRFDAFAACFPAGTVSGAPKVRAIEIVRDLEPTPRGIYAGAVGYFDYRGNMDTCIAIRTIELRDGVAKVQAGAGIVADSVPGSEFEETVNKAKAMFRAIEIAEGE
jgi:anthranilate synthase component 1